MAYDITKWERAKAYFESGQCTLAQISEKVGISKSKISEKAKREKWERGRNADYIEAKKIIAVKRGTEKGTAVAILDEIADDITKHLIFFQNRALANQKKADELLEIATEISEVEAHSRITARNKETVLGKEPTTQINNINAQQNQSANLDLSNLSDDELNTLTKILNKAD